MGKDNILREEDLKKIKDLFDAAENIAVISHKSPDGDTLGSGLALSYHLRSLGKNVTNLCIDKPKDYYFTFEGIDKFVAEIDFAKSDLIVGVDVSSAEMLGFENIKPHLNIDHHISNTRFAENNVVAGEACSTSFLIYQIFRYFDWKITAKTATALLLGIYFDTGSFMHSNTDREVLHVASELIKRGAEKDKIVRALFHTMSIQQIRLWGKILEKIKITKDGVIVSIVTDADLKDCGATSDEVDRVVDFLNMSEGGKFCVLLAENDGMIKGSIRTKDDDIDLSVISKMFGGGGHRKAGGFSFPGKIVEEEVIKIKAD